LEGKERTGRSGVRTGVSERSGIGGIFVGNVAGSEKAVNPEVVDTEELEVKSCMLMITASDDEEVLLSKPGSGETAL
jgi:hypothetical protein